MLPVSRSPFLSVTWSALATAAKTHNVPANSKLRRTFVLLEAFPRQVGWPGLAGTALAATIGCLRALRRTQSSLEKLCTESGEREQARHVYFAVPRCTDG